MYDCWFCLWVHGSICPGFRYNKNFLSTSCSNECRQIKERQFPGWVSADEVSLLLLPRTVYLYMQSEAPQTWLVSWLVYSNYKQTTNRNQKESCPQTSDSYVLIKMVQKVLSNRWVMQFDRNVLRKTTFAWMIEWLTALTAAVLDCAVLPVWFEYTVKLNPNRKTEDLLDEKMIKVTLPA